MTPSAANPCPELGPSMYLLLGDELELTSMYVAVSSLKFPSYPISGVFVETALELELDTSEPESSIANTVASESIKVV